MNEQITKLAIEANSQTGSQFDLNHAPLIKLLDNFASLVAAHEREQCAKVCDALDVEYGGEEMLATWCSEAIRERGEK